MCSCSLTWLVFGRCQVGMWTGPPGILTWNVLSFSSAPPDKNREVPPWGVTDHPSYNGHYTICSLWGNDVIKYKRQDHRCLNLELCSLTSVVKNTVVLIESSCTWLPAGRHEVEAVTCNFLHLFVTFCWRNCRPRPKQTSCCLLTSWPVPRQGAVGHSDICPIYKTSFIVDGTRTRVNNLPKIPSPN